MDPDPDLSYLLTDFFLVLASSPEGQIFSGLFIILLLIASALVSGSEIAFFSLDANDLKVLEEDGKKSSINILKLRERPRKLLATILISNNFINIAIVLLSDFLLQAVLPLKATVGWAEWLISYFPFLQNIIATEILGYGIHFTIAIVGVTFLLVLFGEVAPKVYARFNNISLAKRMAKPLLILEGLFSPLSGILVNGTNAIEKRLTKNSNNNSLTSKQDVQQAIELTVQSDIDGEQEIDILKSIVKFGDLNVKQIMRSRVDVVAIDKGITFPELLKIIRECGYSRIPVIEDDFDSVIGILYVKDLIPYLENGDTFEWQQLIRTTVFYAPETKKINDLLKEFQTERVHMAVVVDEYGGSSGIVTLEDIMEEVIGEIKDEKDDIREIDYVKIDDLNFIFEGKTLLHDVCRIMNIDTDTFDNIRGDSDTVAGMILELTGTLPKQNIDINFGGFMFKILDVTKRRIKRIKIKMPSEIRMQK